MISRQRVSRVLLYFSQVKHVLGVCITFIQCWTNVEDVGPTLYTCYTSIVAHPMLVQCSSELIFIELIPKNARCLLCQYSHVMSCLGNYTSGYHQGRPQAYCCYVNLRSYRFRNTLLLRHGCYETTSIEMVY